MNDTIIDLRKLPQWLFIGYATDNAARPQVFDFSSWVEEYGAGTLELNLQRPGDEVPYPVTLSIEGTTATWTPSSEDTKAKGQGMVQFVYTVGGTVAHTAILRVLIGGSLGAGEDAPNGFENWFQKMQVLAAAAADSADASAASADSAEESAETAAEILEDVGTAGAEQIQAIGEAGTAQITAVGEAGAAQVQAIEDKGEEVLESIPEDYSDLSADVVDLKSSIDNNILPKVGGESQDLHNAATDVIGAYWNQNYEEVQESSTTKYWKHTGLIDIAGFTQIRWENGTTQSTNKLNWFVAADNTPISSFPMAQTGTIDIPENAKYVTFTSAKADAIAIYGIINGSIYDEIAVISEGASHNDNAINRLNKIEDYGYYDLLNEHWTRGGWYNWDSFRTALYKYRAGINTHTHFDVDTQLLCKRGFQILGTAKINGETVSSAGTFSCMFFIPAGADATITVRRINEDTSEELTDEQVQEFASAVMITSVRGSDYMLNRHTFTGIEMYETMGIIGDSYSAGNNSNNWGKCLGRMIGTQVTVWAQSGYTSADWINTYLPRLLEAPALDLYWLNLGINDGSTLISDPNYLGSQADVDETVYPDINTFPNTFWGNYGRIIRNIQQHAPGAKLVMEKTLFANMRNAQTDLDTTKTLTINNAIAAIAEYYGLPCIDQLDDAFYTSREYAKSMTSNHPRKYTWPGMANANRRLFAKAVLDNPEYFY